MITATLFYNRNIGDYGDEEGIEDIENNSDISNVDYAPYYYCIITCTDNTTCA